MQTSTPPLFWQTVPAAHEAGLACVQRWRQKLLMHERPVRQIASVGPELLHGWFTSAISALPQAQMPPLMPRQAWHPPGFCGLHAARHFPATHWAPPAHGWAPLHAWQVAEPAPGKHSCSARIGIDRHWVACPPTAEHVVVEHPMHSGAPPLQHARQNAIAAFASSVAHALQLLQTSDTSQRSPTIPEGMQVPLGHTYPGAQLVAAVACVHWLVQAEVGKQ
jgi:hypothetical protein